MSGDLISGINKILAPLKRKVALMISRAVVDLVDDDKKMQTLQIQVMADETHSDVERFQNYGFTSVPVAGAEALVCYLGGDRSHGIVVAVDDRNFRLKGLTAGQVAMYDAVSKFLLSNDGKALLDAALETHIKSAQVKLGSGAIQEKLLNGETFQGKYNAHTHLAFGVPTTAPIIPSIPTDLSQAVKASTLPV